MADKKSKNDSVETLLTDKQELEEFIERLDLAGEDAPEEVRIRVRNDYDSRLSAVLEELNQYADELNESLKTEVENRESLWEKEKKEKERLAEAKLRHTVGEHSDKEWQEIQAEVDGTISVVGADIEKATGEITRLEDVLGAMTPAPKKKAEKKEKADAPASADKADDSAPKGEAQPQTDAFKEKDITLIKSAKSQAGGQEKPKVVEPAPVEEPVRENIPRPSSIGIDAPLPKADKTLKCAECSTMNFPTEWYCEHCGAELAAL
jgi:hypothetical protein